MFVVLAIAMIFSMSFRADNYVIDNKFAFGFQIPAGWNAAYIKKNTPEGEIRIMLFDEINTISNQSIFIIVKHINNIEFSKHLEQYKGSVLIREVKNPYGRSKTAVFADKDKTYLVAEIDHFGYSLRVLYQTDKKPDIEWFIKLISSYQNIKIHI